MKKLLKFIFLFIFLIHSLGWGATYTCNSDADLDTAIASLADDDIIIINSSWTSDSQYNITKRVTVYGSSLSNTITLGADVSYVFRFTTDSDGSTIRDFTINGNKAARTSGTGVYFAKTNCTVSGMIIYDCFDYGILLHGEATGSTVTENTINTPGGVGINVNTYGNCIRVGTGTHTGTVISNNICTQDSSGGNGNIILNAADGVTISNNIVNNSYGNGIYLYGGSDSNIVTGNIITDFALGAANDGISTNGTNNTIQNNIIRQNNDYQECWGIEITGGAGANNGLIVQNNDVGGTHLDRGISGGGSDIIVRRNKFSSILGDIQQNCSGSEWYYNIHIVTGVSTDAVQLDSNAAGARTITFYNNTIYNSGTGTNGVHFKETSGTWTDINYKNNIVMGFTKGVIIDDKDDNGVSITHINNLYYNNTSNLQKNVVEVYTDISLDSTEIIGNPLFRDVANNNFRLRPGPCIDRGVLIDGLHPGFDFYGMPNWFGPSCDIGASEAVYRRFGTH